MPEPAIRAVERLAGIEALFPSVREQLLAGSLGRAVLGTDYNVIPYSVEWNCLFDTFIAEADRKIATNDFDTTTLADLRPTVIAFSDRIPGSPKLGLDGAPVVRNKRGRKPGSKNKDIKVEERITDLGVMDSVIDGAALRTSKN